MRIFRAFFIAAFFAIPGLASAATTSPALDKAYEEYDNSNFDKALKLFEAECSKNDGEACEQAALMYEDGEGTDKDVHKAKDLYSKSCDLKDGNGCANLGFLYENYEELKGSDTTIFQLYQKGCSINSALSCNNLASVYQDGVGTAKDYAKANTYFQKSCDMKYYAACSGLGYLYDNGFGVEKDIKKATAFYKLACDNEDSTGCYNYGLVLNDDENAKVEDREAAFHTGCIKGYTEACVVLGEAYRDGLYGMDKKPGLSADYFGVACEKDDINSCLNAGELYLQDKEKVQTGIDMLDYACGLYSDEACAKLAWVYSDDTYTKKDLETAKSYIQQANDIDSDNELAKKWTAKFGKK